MDEIIGGRRLFQRLGDAVDIQPIVTVGVEGQGDLIDHQQRIRRRAQGAADLPKRLTQIAPGIGFARIRPEQTGQSFTPVGYRVQQQIGQQ